MLPPDETYRERVRSRIKVNDRGCWLYQGFVNGLGYAGLYYHGKQWRAHRLAYYLWKGPIPQGKQVCHSCDAPSCLNPDHLWLGSNLENQFDSIDKRRHHNATRTHCRHGHDYAAHAYVRPDGRRGCQECNRLRWHNRHSKTVHNAAKTVCKRGHPLSGDNLYVTPGNGRRQCRTCRLQNQLDRRDRLIAQRRQ